MTISRLIPNEDDRVVKMIVARREESVLTFRCQDCEWSWTGPLAEGREHSLRHRQESHPQRRGLDVGSRHSQRAHEVARERTVKPHRIDADKLAIAETMHFEENKSLAEIASIYYRDWGYGSIQNCRKAIGLLLNEKGSKPHKVLARWTPERKQCVQRIYQTGFTIREIGDLVYEKWDYGNLQACRRAVWKAVNEKSGIVRPASARNIDPWISRAEAIALIEEAG